MSPRDTGSSARVEAAAEWLFLRIAQEQDADPGVHTWPPPGRFPDAWREEARELLASLPDTPSGEERLRGLVEAARSMVHVSAAMDGSGWALANPRIHAARKGLVRALSDFPCFPGTDRINHRHTERKHAYIPTCCNDPFRTPEPTEEAPSRVEWSLTGKGEDYAAEVSGPGIPEGVRVGLVAVPTRACPDCNPGDSGCPTCDDHRVIAQPDTEGEGVQGDQDHWRDRAAYWQQAATNLREQLEARAPAPPQPVASEEDFARVRNLLSPGLGVLRYGTADYDALARVLTDARALAQYAKERDE